MAYRPSAEFEEGHPNNQEFENALERLRALKEANISADCMTRYLIAQVKRVLIDEAQRRERYRAGQLFPVLYLNYLKRNLIHSAMPRVKVYFQSSGIRFSIGKDEDSFTILY